MRLTTRVGMLAAITGCATRSTHAPLPAVPPPQALESIPLTNKSVKLLGHDGELQWKQEADVLTITCPAEMPFATAITFRIE